MLIQLVYLIGELILVLRGNRVGGVGNVCRVVIVTYQCRSLRLYWTGMGAYRNVI